MNIEKFVIENGISISGYIGEYIFELIRASGTFYESEILDSWIAKNSSSINIIYDIGANIGNHSLYFAYTTKAKIFSFEPVKDNFDLLQMNIYDNGYQDRITTYNYAVGSQEQDVYLKYLVNNNFGTACISEETDSTLFAKMVCIDNLDLPLPDFIKIDVEGYEIDVLEGMKETLANSSPYVWIEIDDKNVKKCYEFMMKLGYIPYSYFLNRNNNVLFVKSYYSDELIKSLFINFIEIASRSRDGSIKRLELQNRLNKEVSKFLYE